LRLDGAWALTAVRLRWACRVRVLCGRKWGVQYTETKSTVPRDGLIYLLRTKHPVPNIPQWLPSFSKVDSEANQILVAIPWALANRCRPLGLGWAAAPLGRIGVLPAHSQDPTLCFLPGGQITCMFNITKTSQRFAKSGGYRNLLLGAVGKHHLSRTQPLGHLVLRRVARGGSRSAFRFRETGAFGFSSAT